MAGINHIRRWVMGQMTKKADDGIMITLPDSKKVDLNVSITMDRLIRNGIDPDQITNPQQVENALNMIDSRMANRAIPADSAEGREITEKIFGKQKAPVFDMEGNRIPEGSGIMGGKSLKNLMESGQVTKGARGMDKSKKVQDREMFQAANERLTSDVDTIVKNIKRLSPMDAMKEANLVIGRKGYYKNLTPEESKKILQDTEDHIFERDIPEDFAAGGIARIGLKGGLTPSDYLKVKDMLEHYHKYKKSGKPKISKADFAREFFRENNADGGRIGLVGGGMGRRGFLKLLGSLGAGAAAIKTGILGLGGKQAGKEVVKEVAQSAGSGTPPPYFFKLVEKIKTMGDDVTEKYSTQERQVVKQYKDYELTEDMGTGKIEISKKNFPEGDEAVDYFGEPLMEDVYMSYKPGEMVEGAGGKVLKSADEYIEDTAYVRSRGPQTGDIASEMDGIAEGTLEKIIKDIEEAPSIKIKKASGGVARLLGE